MRADARYSCRLSSAPARKGLRYGLVWLLEMIGGDWSTSIANARALEIVDDRDGRVVQSFDGAGGGAAVLRRRVAEDLTRLSVADFQQTYGIDADA